MEGVADVPAYSAVDSDSGAAVAELLEKKQQQRLVVLAAE